MNVLPLGNFVFIRPIGMGMFDDTGKIIIPESMRVNDCQRGVVEYKGPSADLNIKCGEAVLYSWYSSYRSVKLELRGKEERLLVVPNRFVLSLLFGDSVEDAVPLSDWVLIEWPIAPEMYAGGKILRAGQTREKFFVGTVLKTGPKCEDVKPGMEVFFNNFGKVETFHDNNKRYAIFRESNVIGVLERREATHAN